MELIDNVNLLWGDDLKRKIGQGSKLKVAASCFSIFAFEALKKELEQVDELEFIFTSPTFLPEEVTDKVKKEHREFYIPKLERERSLYGSEFEIHLRNQLTQKAIARECAAWLRRRATFKSNLTKAPMQQFACINSAVSEVAYMPLQGFTAVDLGYQAGNAVSNFITRFDEAGATKTWLSLFEQVWNDESKLTDVTESIISHIESVYKENSPERIYFLILYHIFNEFLDNLEDALPNDRTGYQESVIWNKLFNFQRDAAVGIINKLDTFNGCILADSVGLGKTFTALAVIKYYELRNKSVLVLCPKKLADNWTTYKGNKKTNILFADRLNYDVLCHTDLLRETGESLGMRLSQVNWGNYDLIVIDESNNFRNNEAFKEKETRYQRLMRQVIKAGVKTKVLMLSATPVNNKFGDLRNQLALAYEGESNHLRAKLNTRRSIEDIFRRAQKSFNQWSKLEAEERTAKAILDTLDFDFFEVLDSVTIARSRKHIETFYDNADIGRFPVRLKPLSFHCQLTTRNDVLSFNGIYKELTRLNLSVYMPINYILPSKLSKYEALYDTLIEGGKSVLKQKDREESLKALMTINLLKRLESSVAAFRLTLQSLLEMHNQIMGKIVEFQNSGGKTTMADLSNLESLDNDGDEDWGEENETIGKKIQVDLADMDLDRWENDLTTDMIIVEELLGNMLKIRIEDDYKLQHLKALLQQKIQNQLNYGNKKVLIFSAYADTAIYLYGALKDELKENLGLHSGLITGKEAPKNNLKKGLDFQTLLTFFSPRSKQRDLLFPNEEGEIEILFATDCISEGQNLQDCDYLINYDIHWNPVRIIQRFGRIDRIGSPNERIQLVNYWPDISLDEYINLKERVENRMVVVDLAGTGDDNVLTSKANDVSYRKEQLRRLQEEVIDLEDLKTGVNITDLGLNDFRMDLLNFMKENGDVRNLPHGMHAVVPASPEMGLVPGVLFALKNRNPDLLKLEQNRLHPFYLLYMEMNGALVHGYTNVKLLLDVLRNRCKGVDEPIMSLCKAFNKETKDGRDMSRYSELLSASIRNMLDAKEENDLESLFSSSRTTALLHSIKGLEDFELIAFLVIR